MTNLAVSLETMILAHCREYRAVTITTRDNISLHRVRARPVLQARPDDRSQYVAVWFWPCVVRCGVWSTPRRPRQSSCGGIGAGIAKKSPPSQLDIVWTWRETLLAAGVSYITILSRSDRNSDGVRKCANFSSLAAQN